MRIGGLVFETKEAYQSLGPETWVAEARRMGYRAVYFPVDYRAPVATIDAYVEAAKEADLKIAEVGVWNNTLDPDPQAREEAIEQAIHQLELADYVGAACCVNVSGSRGAQWDGPDPLNFSKETFDLVVKTTQRIIDAVKPTRTTYSLEPMPWMIPHTPESYLDLMEAIDRDGFGVHMDPVNTITSLDAYYHTGREIDHWFDVLGEHIVSCHAKDIQLGTTLTLHLNECRPGTGNLDYPRLIQRLLELEAEREEETCLMLEHMTQRQDYVLAMEFLDSVLSEQGE